MKTTIMVTGTGQLGVGEGLIQCLELERDQYRLIAANATPYAASLYTCDAGLLLPQASSAAFLETLKKVCVEYQVEFLIPGSEPELRQLADRHDEFAALGTTLLCNTKDVVDIGDDKFRTYEFLSTRGLATPRSIRGVSVDAAEILGFPLVVKPYFGGGSKHVHIVNSLRELELVGELLQIKGVDAFVQEYVGEPGQEFTASALMTPEGECIGSFAARRSLAGGASATAEVRDFPEVRAMAEQVADLLEATGPINIQARLHKGEVSVFEINPRFSGSAPFRALSGFNEPHLLIQRLRTTGVMNLPHPRENVLGIRSFAHTLVPLDEVEALTQADA